MTRAAVLSISVCLGLLSLGLLETSVNAFNPLSDNNLVNYWGQNPGTGLLHCPRTGEGVKMCQSKGKAVILSLGGAAGAYGFSDDAEAKDFAHTIWNLFLGGSSGTRPLDDAILDGVDLDIEGGSAAGYPAFIAELRSLFAADTRKQYYITAAPQCPFPDAYLGVALQSAWVDMVFVQYYNNYCGTQAYGSFNFNFEQWDTWAKTISVNKNVKVYLGVPASRTAANAGYVSVERLQEIMDTVRCKYSSFGGVMMWDMSQSYGNLESGTEYSVAAAKSLKRPRNLVCGDSEPAVAPAPVPVPPPTPAPPPVVAPPPASVSPPQTPTPPPPVVAPPPAPVPPLQAPAPPPPVVAPPPASVPLPQAPAPLPVHAPAPAEPSTPSDNNEESRCPVKGAACTMPSTGAFLCDGYEFATCLYACAPGTYCTTRGCDFIKGPVLGCLEAEKVEREERVMKNQIRDAIDLMWGVFDHVNDPTWDRYIEIDEDEDEDDDVPVASEDDRQNDAPQQQPQQQQQKPLNIPERVADVEAKMRKAKDTSDDYLIDFIQLETGQEFVSFGFDPTEADAANSKTFRTQVRIRTNNDAINPLWRVSFFVKHGETVKSVTRGTFVQNGSRVVITSKPKEEAHKSMVIRFVIEGVRTTDPLSDGLVGTVSPDSLQDPDMSAPHGLPDPAFAKFEHKAVKL
ncbi:Chitinase 1 [Mortierella sp. AD032]|nr:Chitinase 1 [Mortierella sp. AD032]